MKPKALSTSVPTPRERYVTDHYSDAGYRKLVRTYTSEVVFQKP